MRGWWKIALAVTKRDAGEGNFARTITTFAKPVPPLNTHGRELSDFREPVRSQRPRHRSVPLLSAMPL